MNNDPNQTPDVAPSTPPSASLSPEPSPFPSDTAPNAPVSSPAPVGPAPTPAPSPAPAGTGLPVVGKPSGGGKGKLILVVVFVLLLIGAGVAGYYYFQSSQNQSSSQDNNTADEKKADEKAETKQFTSKKYGISFATPSDWEVTETDTGAAGADTALLLYRIGIAPPNDTTGGVEFRVSEGTLDDVIAQQTETLESTPGFSFETSDYKWNDYEGKHLIMKNNEGETTTEVTMLFVQVGDLVYLVPDSKSTPAMVTSKVVTQEVWDAFVQSIQIKAEE